MLQLLALPLVLPVAWPRVDDASAANSARGSGVAVVERIVVVGSSVSDGFGLDKDVGVKTTLADVVNATLKTEHGPVRSATNTMFFVTPDASGQALVKAAQDVEPTLVVALDYLFWFGYGDLPGDEARLALLERGLASLEAFDCPILVGDFPDMSLALEVKDNPIVVLTKTQVPPPESLEALNRRVRAWAAKDPRRMVVRVADLMRKLRADEEFALRRNTWYRGSLAFLLQKDRLHTTLQGSIALWIHALDELVRAQPGIPETAFVWDAQEIWRAVYNAKEAERNALAEQKIEKLRQERKPPPEPPPGPTPKKDG